MRTSMKGLLVAALTTATVLVAPAPVVQANTRPAEGFQCRLAVGDIRSRPGNPQIIEPIKASNRCLGGITRQSVTVFLQWYNPRGPLRPGRWEQVTKRTSSRRGPGPLSISTRWNCGDPHRNNAGRVRLRVVATGWVIDWDGDPGGASARAHNEITRDCAV